MRLLHFCIVLPLIFLNSCSQEKEKPFPNIIIILADDLGYGDLGCYNSQSLIPTPNLDRLAESGVRLTNAYCPVSVCSPSRYALMTGRYPWKSWRKSGVMRNYERSMIDSEILTLPEMLQQAGYTTAGFGKWHLGTSFQTLDGNPPAGFEKFRADDNGANLDLSKPVLDGPMEHGFDHWLGFSCASETWLFENDQIFGAISHDLYTIEATPNKDDIRVIPLADYLPFISEETAQYLKQQSKLDQPFFLYFSPYVPHIPLAVSDEFKGTTKAGLYGDYVHELDHYIGKILEQLRQLGLEENTIVLFGSDNGSQFRITSPQLDSMAQSNSPADVFEDESLTGHRPNRELRGTKWSIFEGGVRMPFIAKWPGAIKPGSVGTGIFSLNDIMATIATIVEFDLEAHAEDSQNQLPLLFGQKDFVRSEIVMQSSGREFAIRNGKWKYIWKSNNQSGELYDLENDPSELSDVHEENQSLSSEIHKRLMEILEENISFDK